MDIYFFQNLMTLMFEIWEIWDEEPRSIGVTCTSDTCMHSAYYH